MGRQKDAKGAEHTKEEDEQEYTPMIAGTGLKDLADCGNLLVFNTFECCLEARPGDNQRKSKPYFLIPHPSKEVEWKILIRS